MADQVEKAGHDRLHPSGRWGTRPLVRDNNSLDLAGADEELFSDTVFNYSSYVVAAILFLILTIPLARFTDHLIRRDQARRLAGAGQ